MPKCPVAPVCGAFYKPECKVEEPKCEPEEKKKCKKSKKKSKKCKDSEYSEDDEDDYKKPTKTEACRAASPSFPKGISYGGKPGNPYGNKSPFGYQPQC